MPPRTIALPKGIPASLKFGSVAFKVFATQAGQLGFRYKVGSAWKQVLRRDFAKLRRDAERIGLGLLNADTAALDMTADERRIYIHARELLQPHGLSVDAAARLLSDAARFAGGAESIIEACRNFSQSGGTLRNAATAEVVAHFIRHLSSDGVSDLYLTPMKADLAKFTARFPGQFATVQTSAMEDWLREMPVGLRRRRNLRDKLVAIFNFARDNNYLASGLRTEAEKIKRPKVARKAPAIYSPHELDLILTQCVQPSDKKVGRKDYMDFLPSIVIAAFAGLRWAEIQRLDWRDVHWEDGVIAVGDENKTGYRLAPIQPNLMTWIASYRNSTGPVCLEKRPDHALHSIRSRAGIPGRDRHYANALRHSCITYRVAVIKNMPQVAVESGNSVPEIRRSYNRASLEKIGLQWFGMVRDASNVVQMPLLSMRGLSKS